MKAEGYGGSQFIVTPSDGDHETIVKLADIYGVSYEETISIMFAFASYMAQSRILSKI